jgi:hypothetical protein
MTQQLAVVNANPEPGLIGSHTGLVDGSRPQRDGFELDVRAA